MPEACTSIVAVLASDDDAEAGRIKLQSVERYQRVTKLVKEG